MTLDSDLKVAYDLKEKGRLRWCSGPCACMGTCANFMVSKEQWKRIEAIPEIKLIIDKEREIAVAAFKKNMANFREMIKERRLEKDR